MASGPLHFRTPHIEEIPIANAKQAPGFAWVAVPKDDPARAQLEVASKKRSRTAVVSEEARDTATKRRQREMEMLIARLNTEGTKDVSIPGLKKDLGAKAGKTAATKKILASNKDFKHHIDDEEAELARTGRGEGIQEDSQRASKIPLARRVQHEDSIMTDAAEAPLPFFAQEPDEDNTLGDFDAIPPFPSMDVVQALLDATPLTFAASTHTPSYNPTAPPRRFCEICGYWGRSRCLKCGSWTCSVECQTNHLADRCQKFYS